MGTSFGRGAARLGLGLLAALLGVACTGDTAIVLSIRTSDGTIANATRLDVFVGVGGAVTPDPDPASVVVPAWWRRAAVAPTDDGLVFPTGLGTAPFDLALSPSSDLALGDEIVFAVAATASDARSLVGFAHADAPLHFVDGQIRVVPVELVVVDDSAAAGGVTDTGCAWWRADPSDPVPGRVRDRAIVPSADADCDEFPAPAPGQVTDCDPTVDCNDRDPNINPGRDPDCSDVDVDCCLADVGDATDADHDGVKICAGDCVDSGQVLDVFGAMVDAGAIRPGLADTSCDGVDQACAIDAGGKCDSGVPDVDGDHYISCVRGGQIAAVRTTDCAWFPRQRDCLEQGDAIGVNPAGDPVVVAAADVHPTADDVECDGIDQDCTDACDDGGPDDADGDGFPRCRDAGDVARPAVTCRRVNVNADCDDGSFFGRPIPENERCDGFDSLCDSMPDTTVASAGLCLPTTMPGELCALGRPACAERFDGQAAFRCDVSTPLSAPFPDALCRGCATGDGPLSCGDGRFQTCHVRTGGPAETAACDLPPQATLLSACPASVGGPCTWAVVGSTTANGWRVGLVISATSSSGGSPMLTGTTAAVRVFDVGPQPQAFIFKRQGTPDVYEIIRFDRAIPATCSPMLCDLPMQ